MLRITVNEKGGPERELYLESDSVTLGRVQGNDIVLPKPNVSKRHASIRRIEGTLQIEDLRSTNGTYVNGRRISAPREFGAEDRIQVGDFAIRVELLAGRAERDSDAMPLPSHEEAARATIAMPVVAPGAVPTPPPAPPPVAPAPPPEDEDSAIVLDIEVVSDDEPSQVEPPPMVPDRHGSRHVVSIEESGPVTQPPIAALESVSALYEPPHTGRGQSEGTSPGARGLVRRVAPIIPDTSEGAAPEEYMEALRLVTDLAAEPVFGAVDPLRDEFGDAEWQELSDRVMRLIDRLRREKRFPAAVDPFLMTQDVLFEFTGLGPLEELLGDESVRAVMVDGLNRIFVRRGATVDRLPKGFASEATQGRVVAKLLALAGIEDNGAPTLEGRLPDGSFVQVINPPLTSEGRVIVMERPVISSLTMNDFLAAGLIQQDAHDSLVAAVSRHENVVVCGCMRAGQATFLNALLRVLPTHERVLLLEGRREIVLRQPNVVALNKGPLGAMGEAAGQVVHRLSPDLVVVPDLEPADVRLLAGLGLVGQRGLIASMVADSWQTCLSRLVLMVQFQSPQLRPETTERMVQQVVDCVVILRPGENGRSRVAQVVHLDRNGGAPRVIGGVE